MRFGIGFAIQWVMSANTFKQLMQIRVRILRRMHASNGEEREILLGVLRAFDKQLRCAA